MRRVPSSGYRFSRTTVRSLHFCNSAFQKPVCLHLKAENQAPEFNESFWVGTTQIFEFAELLVDSNCDLRLINLSF